MHREEFEILAGFLKRRSGLSITQAKSRLIENRLKPIAVRRGFKDVGGLARALDCPDEELGGEVADAMTTYDTSFFRDPALFHSLRETIFPALASAREDKRSLKIWCAACSTGEEPYSLAMTADGSARFDSWAIEILATDVSLLAIERASAGVYSQYEVMRGLPIRMLGKYFVKEHDDWRVVRAIRDRIRFRVFNLLDSFDALGKFDIIFCRNVLIYFDQATKAQVLARLSRALAPDGYLVLGEAETVLGLVKSFAPVPTMRGVFVPTDKTATHRHSSLG
ncbi:MAG TPA: protein-glutamate O-methyltransferase CheR [Micropepsaceae bacterium]|nr:protein-glutamate O-methyltransferase CheR [Micropepsaceae bacterium]